MSETLIKVEGLSKKFCSSLKRSMLYGTTDVMRDMIGFPYKVEKLRKKEFWALQDVNFELKRGETLGLVGQNGCGKTTLLRLINGIFPPDKGKITINGRIGALIAVGAGFHPHMTGRENVFLNGTILGMTKAELKRKFDAIADFAEIGSFIDAPVATYSSGMRVRLGFSIAIHCEPDILLLDEILAVGDSSFQGKCFNKIFEFQEKGVGILLVSHNDQVIYDRCNKAALLDHGKLLKLGNVSDVMIKYNQVLVEQNNKAFSPNNIDTTQKKNPLSINLSIEDIKYNKIEKINTNDSFYIVADIKSEHDLDNLSWGVSLASKDNSRILYLSTKKYDIPPIKINKGKNILKLRINKLNLMPGVYSLRTGLMNRSDEKPFYEIKPFTLIVKGVKNSNALFYVDVKWEINLKISQ